MGYIDKETAMNLDFRINVSLFESRRKTAERAVQAYADAISAIPEEAVRADINGKWVDVTVAEWADLSVASMRCNQCDRYHNEVYHYGRPTENAHFCPFCGARMEVDTNDS